LNTHGWGYALLCVFLPVLWGLAMVWVTNWFERRYRTRRRHSPHDTAPSTAPILEYHI
jgi:hypothetical protein